MKPQDAATKPENGHAAGRPRLRARIGRVLMIVAVLVPVALVMGGIWASRFFLAHFSKRPLGLMMFADGAVLAVGLWLQRGEEL